MKKLLFAALALSCILLPAEAKKKVRVHTIGDSTMADYAENTTRTRGWGEMFQEFFSDDVEVMNYARGGRSTRSFINEGLWDKVKANIRKGDYVLIQFAHNDENQYNQFFINYPYDVLNSIGIDNIGKNSVVKISPTINENVCNTTLNEVLEDPDYSVDDALQELQDAVDMEQEE